MEMPGVQIDPVQDGVEAVSIVPDDLHSARAPRVSGVPHLRRRAAAAPRSGVAVHLSVPAAAPQQQITQEALQTAQGV